MYHTFQLEECISSHQRKRTFQLNKEGCRGTQIHQNHRHNDHIQHNHISLFWKHISSHQHKRTYQLNKEGCRELQIHQNRPHTQLARCRYNFDEHIVNHQHKQTYQLNMEECRGTLIHRNHLCNHNFGATSVDVMEHLYEITIT